MVVEVPEGALKPKYIALSRKRKWEESAWKDGHDAYDQRRTSGASPARNITPAECRPVRMLREIVSSSENGTASGSAEPPVNVWGEFKDRSHFVEMHLV